MTRDYKPDAITLDICLPDIDGWRVLDRLKNDMATAAHPRLRHLDRGGAASAPPATAHSRVLTKPIQSRETLEQLLDDHPRLRRPAASRTWSSSAPTRPAASEIARVDRRRRVPGHHGAERRSEALELLERKRVDCLVLDSSLPDMTPDEFLGTHRAEGRRHDACR